MSKRGESDPSPSSLIAPSWSTSSSNGVALSLMVAIFLVVSSSISPNGLGAHGQVNFSTGWYNGKRSSLPALRSNAGGAAVGQQSAAASGGSNEAGSNADTSMSSKSSPGTLDPLFQSLQQADEDHQHRDETILGTRRATSRSIVDPTITTNNPAASRMMRGSEGDSMSNRIFPTQGHYYNHDDADSNGAMRMTMSKRIPLGPEELIERLEASMSEATTTTTTTPEECRVMSPAALNNIYRLLFREAEKMVQCGRIFGRKKRSTSAAT